MIQIPASELYFTFARSSGAGGQHINKVATKAVLHWSIGASQVLDNKEKELIRKKLTRYRNSVDEIVLSAEDKRSQLQNRQEVQRKLHRLLNQALVVQKKRFPTKPTKASKWQRLETKRKHSQIKKKRRNELLFE